MMRQPTNDINDEYGMQGVHTRVISNGGASTVTTAGVKVGCKVNSTRAMSNDGSRT